MDEMFFSETGSIDMDAETLGKGYLEGGAAVLAAQRILQTPGVVAIDFETWPTNPAWHGEQAARHAPRGKQAQARERAVREARLHVRAHKRKACTVQLRHEDGSELFARLLDPARELPAMLDDLAATLVAHNAQFETEVLLKNGVEASIECTMIAAKCLYLVAVPEDAPQPVRFGLADLVAKDLGQTRDKSIRDRDWREPPDAEAVAYGLQDVRDTLALWQLYEPRLREAGLWDGYRVMARSLLPTAAINVEGGLVLDAAAHAALMRGLTDQASALKLELDQACFGVIENHGSTAQVSAWVVEEVTGVPVKPPVAPRSIGLKEFLRRQGGIRPDQGGELRSRDLPRSLVRLDGMSLWDATIAAWEAGYIGMEHSRFDDDAEQPTEEDLLAALDQERFGHKVLPLEDDMAASDHESAAADFEARRGSLEMRDVMAKLAIRLHAKTNGAVKGWRTTKTGCLAITKGSKMRKAEQLAEAFPNISGYLVKHAQWTAKTKLLDGFGVTLRRWMDVGGTVRGQHKVFGAWTGRQSCADPNLQNQPHDPAFRALWCAAPGRKLVVADYSQIELRLLAIEAGDERLREVYRLGRDVHQETADIAGIPRKLAKNVNFAMAYGSGAAGLSENFGFELEESQRILAAVLGAYPGLADYRQRAPQAAAANGFITIRPGRRVEYNARNLARVAHRARDRADVDDLAKDLAALLALGLRGLTEVGGRSADDAEGHDRVDLEHGLELLVGHLVSHSVPGVARVVDDDVEPAELVDGLLHKRIANAALGEVAAEHGGLARDLGRRLLGHVRVEIVDQDTRSLLGQELRGGAADPACGAGDDRGLSIEDSHLQLSPCFADGRDYPRWPWPRSASTSSATASPWSCSWRGAWLRRWVARSAWRRARCSSAPPPRCCF